MKKDRVCLSVHLFYAGRWDELLVEAVKPFVRELLSDELISDYFFIRYWEKGPHIRLRMFGGEEALINTVRPRLVEYFESYMSRFPSDRNEPEWLQRASQEDQWLPNNSIQFIDYEPEYERYGGSEMVKIAEKLFGHSSNSVLSIMLNEHGSWGYDRAMGAAIQLHLGMTYSLGMDLSESLVFYNYFFEHWLSRAYYFFREEISSDELIIRREKTLNTFQEQFEAQRTALVPMVSHIWELLEQGVSFDENWLNEWISGVADIKEQLTSHFNKDWQIDHNFFKPSSHEGYSLQDQKKWNLFDSYIHMTNNRLGIFNHDEAYLAFFLKESLKCMSLNLQAK